MLTYFEDNFHNIHNLFHDVNPSIFYPFIRKVKPHQRFQVFRGNPRVTIQMQTIVQCFHEVLFKVVLTSKFVDETLVCGHSNESY